MISSKIISKTVQDLLKNKDDIKITDSLINYLKQNHLAHLLPNILKHIERDNGLSKAHNKIEIITSHEVGQEVIEKIKSYVASWEGKEFVTSVDKSILSGVIVKGKNKILDASLKTNLNKLKELLKK